MVRGVTESNPHGTYDHHMMVISVIDDVTLKVIHYTGEVADAARGGAISSFSFFSNFGSGSEETDCKDDQGGGASDGGDASAAVVENIVKILVSNEKIEVLSYPEESSFEVFPPDKAIERARSRLGEKEYGLFKNNCECFVNWAITDQAVSNQFESGKWVTGLSTLLGAYAGYKEGGWSGAARGALTGAQQGYQYHRENRH